MSPVRAATLAILFVLLASGPTRAGELQRIELRDGSTIVAEVRSLQRGVYRLESPSLGTIRIAQERVRRIAPAGPQRSATPSSPTPSSSPDSHAAAGQVAELQQRLVGDPAALSVLLRLGELPEMQEVLSDPEILRAAESGDLGALENHPKIQKLMGVPAVRDLTGRAATAP